MPEAPLTARDAGQTGDIDAFYQPTHDEYARQRLVSALRKHVLVDMKGDMTRTFNERAVPAFKKTHKRTPKNDREISKLMEPTAAYRFYSSARYNAQEMVWASVQEPIERVLPDMIAVAKDAAARHPTGGSLHLDPAFEVPRYVSSFDVHLIPGCFHTEHAPDDVAQGAVTAYGGMVFSGGLAHRKNNPGAVAQSVAYWLRQEFPEFKPRRVLDIGTSTGKNLLPYRDAFPGCELYGIDVGAPLLRFAHAQAEHAGKPAHYSQQNAERTNFPDGSFDLIVSSFFFHEIPVPVTKKVLKECHRLLAKGGIMAHMELPHARLCDAYVNFFWNWDTRNNNEPAYAAFRAQNPKALAAAAGFGPKTFFEVTIPNIATFGETNFAKWKKGELPAPAHGAGGWYIFGARKHARA